MGILQQLQQLEDKVAVMEGWKGHIAKMEAKEWEEKYWIVVRQLRDCQKNCSEKFSTFAQKEFLIEKTAELNIWQAGRISELEFLLSFIRRVGDGVIILDSARLRMLYRFFDDFKQQPQRELLPCFEASRYWDRNNEDRTRRQRSAII